MKTDNLPTVYIAGPQVFSKHAVEFYKSAEATCESYGLKALVPFDLKLQTIDEIFKHNLRHIEAATYLAVDVNSWRGTEPDSGSVWEGALGWALGKPVFYYSKDIRTVRDRVLDHFGLARFDPTVWFPDGSTAEDFGKTHNLMLDRSGHMVGGDLRTVCAQIKKIGPQVKTYEPGWLVCNGKPVGQGRAFRKLDCGIPVWTEDRDEALRFARRKDADSFCEEDGEAWSILTYSQVLFHEEITVLNAN